MTAAPPQKKTFSGDVFDADAVAVFVAYKVPIITNAVTAKIEIIIFLPPPPPPLHLIFFSQPCSLKPYFLHGPHSDPTSAPLTPPPPPLADNK